MIIEVDDLNNHFRTTMTPNRSRKDIIKHLNPSSKFNQYLSLSNLHSSSLDKLKQNLSSDEL